MTDEGMSFQGHNPRTCPDCVVVSADESSKVIRFRCSKTGRIYVMAPVYNIESEKVTYCQVTYGEREGQTTECVKRVRPYVDRCLIVHDGSFSDKFMDWLTTEMKCELVYHPWNDNFPEYRNAYLEKVTDGWVIVSDPDEWYNDVFCRNIKEVVKMSMNGQRFNAVKINSHGIFTKIDGTKEESGSSFYKMLMFKWYPGVRYVGIGQSRTVHEDLVGGPGWHTIKLPDDCFYTHVKEEKEVWERAWRNLHIGGGGNNLGEVNPMWPKYRLLVSQINPELLRWENMRAYMRKGNIDQRLKDFLVENRNRNVINDADGELREAFKLYFTVLHPDENVGGWKSEPEPSKPMTNQDVRDFVQQCYLAVLGRHADEPGLNAYTEHILSGRVRRTDLPLILMQSDEFKSLQKSKEIFQGVQFK